MRIETPRLALVPLTAAQLRLWLEDMPALESELGCVYRAEPMKGAFRDIVKEQLKATEQDPENYPWHSFWLLIRKSDNIAVGAVDFKDVPDSRGVVEIGYGLGGEYEHNGYMTEAVEAMCGWALVQKDVTHVIAETDLNGLASQRVLQRCGFSELRRGETVWWKL